MTEHVYPTLFALFIWWFSTGVIMYLDGLPQRTFRWSMLGATIILLLALWGLVATANDTSLTGAYLAFTCGLLAWGWQQISFYMGYITGTRRVSCSEHCSGWRHFGHAVQVSIWHEFAIIAGAIVIFWLTWGGANQIGTWTFVVLWWMHQSAKLNVFFGVRNLNEEFLPEHLDFLKSYLTKKSMNLFFPVSVTISTMITVVLAQKAFATDASTFEAVGFTFLTVMMALAILEHWFLILPIPAAALWQWGLASRTSKKKVDVEVIAGFLGAGKTNFLQKTLAKSTRAEKTVLLVSDFSTLGSNDVPVVSHDTDIVELPNGCICCSLGVDLAEQVKDLVVRFAPDRVFVEPSGTADVASLIKMINAPDLSHLIGSLRVYMVIDGSAFLKSFGRMQGYFETQALLAPVLIINKTDLISDIEFETVRETLRRINPDATVVSATYGEVEVQGLNAMAAINLPKDANSGEALDHDQSKAHGHDHSIEPEVALNLKSWSTALAGSFDASRLRPLLDKIAAGDFGEVDRVKGIARAGGGWVQFGVAGGRATMAAFTARDDETPRVVAIGKSVDGDGLLAAFKTAGVEPALA